MGIGLDFAVCRNPNWQKMGSQDTSLVHLPYVVPRPPPPQYTSDMGEDKSHAGLSMSETIRYIQGDVLSY